MVAADEPFPRSLDPNWVNEGDDALAFFPGPGGTLTNNNLISGTVAVSGTGTVANNLTITGAVNNAATFDNNANGTVDFGVFKTQSLGNSVWQDTNNNGTADAGEPGLDGVTVNLYADSVAPGNLVTSQATTSGS